jgi:general stress protein CsbA
MIQLLAALFLPAMLVVLFSHITYNRIIGLILTVALIAASAYKGYTHTWPVIITDAFSLTAGFWLSAVLKNRLLKKS